MNNQNDQYTRAILGEKLLLTLGRPNVAHAHAVPFAWVPAELRPRSNGSALRRGDWVLIGVGAVLIAGAAALLVIPGEVGQWMARAGIGGGTRAIELPVGRADEAVRVIEEDYQPKVAGIPVLPIPNQAMPVPLPPGALQSLPLSAPVPMPQLASPAPAQPARAKSDEDSKDAPAVLLDDSHIPAAKPADKKIEAKPDVKPPAPPANAQAAPSAPPATLPKPSAAPAQNATAVAPAQAPVKLATPVEEKSAGGGAVASPSAAQAAKPGAPATGPKLATPVEDKAVATAAAITQAKPAGAETGSGSSPVRITIVDIAPNGKSVLVTNPATRLPTRISVGEKLPNGKTIQSIDPSAGTVVAEGTTYKLD